MAQTYDNLSSIHLKDFFAALALARNLWFNIYKLARGGGGRGKFTDHEIFCYTKMIDLCHRGGGGGGQCCVKPKKLLCNRLHGFKKKFLIKRKKCHCFLSLDVTTPLLLARVAGEEKVKFGSHHHHVFSSRRPGHD